MRRFSLGIFSMAIATFAGAMYALHYGGIFPFLNSMLVPILTIVGLLLGVVGFFERDKKKTPALVGMVLNLVFLVWFAVLFVDFLIHKP
jgi:hypothetical protein